mmetsp:Transcript_31534/g.50970  ORF Transcript_31534/g.50970 Transcript_31534/m.50970 type:complete len:216 (-) Transcript_31534:112-759(-)
MGGAPGSTKPRLSRCLPITVILPSPFEKTRETDAVTYECPVISSIAIAVTLTSVSDRVSREAMCRDHVWSNPSKINPRAAASSLKQLDVSCRVMASTDVNDTCASSSSRSPGASHMTTCASNVSGGATDRGKHGSHDPPQLPSRSLLSPSMRESKQNRGLQSTPPLSTAASSWSRTPLVQCDARTMRGQSSQSLPPQSFLSSSKSRIPLKQCGTR